MGTKINTNVREMAIPFPREKNVTITVMEPSSTAASEDRCTTFEKFGFH
jgi:hypothetical protein